MSCPGSVITDEEENVVTELEALLINVTEAVPNYNFQTKKCEIQTKSGPKF